MEPIKEITLEDITQISNLDHHEQMDCLFSWMYANKFRHRTDGASRLALVAKLVDTVLAQLKRIKELETEIENMRHA